MGKTLLKFSAFLGIDVCLLVWMTFLLTFTSQRKELEHLVAQYRLEQQVEFLFLRMKDLLDE